MRKAAAGKLRAALVSAELEAMSGMVPISPLGSEGCCEETINMM